MDIEYLLFLQGIRESLGGGMENFFVLVSAIGHGLPLLLLAFGTYWCLDKRTGIMACSCFAVGMFVNQSIKNTVCAYRPWIRDARIAPAQAALPEATGYSFPSGHTVLATTTGGLFAWELRKRWRLLSCLLVLLALLVGFSRNYLGVHTPQDVCAGILVSVAVIAGVRRLAAWVEAHPGCELHLLWLALVLTLAHLAYVQLKPYPLDFVDGKVLVDPITMQVDCFKAAGSFFGLALGWFLERRYIKFSTNRIGRRERLVRLAIGSAVALLTYVVLGRVLSPLCEARSAALIVGFVSYASLIAGVPALFTALEGRHNQR